MLTRLLDWIDHRTGHRALAHDALFERIPSGARFRYVTGSMLVFAFVTQAITGIFLWMAYSPSSTTAYESVYYIQHEMTGGWLLRGIHHFMAQAMVVVMVLHLFQVIWDGAYRPPREFNYWNGLVLMMLVMGLGLTGYLLPWDQKGYWATNVATNLMTLAPGIGKQLQQVAIGGTEYGHHTLTRFFAMHAGVLPALLIAFLGLHIALFRRHGITAHITAGRRDDFFWPRQVLFDAIACLALFTLVLLLVIHFDLPGLLSGKLPEAHKGAELGAPADPSQQFSAARPEWYYLFLFQLLKYFPGTSEFIGAIVIPTVAVILLFLLPIFGIWRAGHQLSRTVIIVLILGAAVLTGLALNEDYYALIAPRLGIAPDEKKLAASREFLEAREAAERDAERTVQLINRRETNADGTLSEPRLIPREGAVTLLRNDPLTHGQRLFDQHCASCHSYDRPTTEEKGTEKAPAAASSAPDLYAFASRSWIKRLLSEQAINGPEVFGNTAHKNGRMATWLKQNASLLKDDPAKPDDNVDAIAAALSAQSQIPSQAPADAADAELIRRGVRLIEQNCTRGCHQFGDHGQLGLAPDLTGYGSYAWMMGFLSDPTHDRFYRHENDRMPSFAKDLAHPENNALSVREMSLIVDWLRGQYFRADDKAPILAHNQAAAREALLLATSTSTPAIIGAAPKPAETERQRAERLFTSNCAACHNNTDEHGRGIAARVPSAPNLYGFGSRAWLTGLLDPQRIGGDDYFGNTRHVEGDMVGFVQADLAMLDADGKAKVKSIIEALSAEAKLPAQEDADASADKEGTLEKGRAALAEAFENSSCTDCHKFGDTGDLGSAPDLTGWASADWLTRLITDPTHEAFYATNNDRMPSFGMPGTGTKQALLTPAEITLLTRYLRNEVD